MVASTAATDDRFPAGPGFAHLFLGHGVPPPVDQKRGMERRRTLAKRACSAAQLYTYPSAGTTFAAGKDKPITITWNPTCYAYSMVDITLYAPHLSVPEIKKFYYIPYADGKFQVTLLPKWWNSTTTIDLQFQLAESKTLIPFFGPIPGPLFQVTYPAEQLVTTTVGGSTVAAAAADTGSPDPIATIVTKEASGGLPAGSIFAAVFFPLAIIVGGVVLYILYTRRKQSKKRQRWSQAVDNRMSVISSHWDRTSSHHGPSASLGGGTPRKSGAFSQTAARRTMHSTYSASENFAGYGAHRTDDYPSLPQQEMVEVVDPSAEFARPRTQFGAERKSRGVSFASEFDGAAAAGHNSKLNSVYSQGHQRSKSSLSGAMGAALRQRPSLYTNPSSTTINVVPTPLSTFAQQRQSMAGEQQQQRKESIEMVLSPDQTSGPWVLGEDDVDGFRSPAEQQENLVEADGEKLVRRASQFAGAQTLGVLTDASNRASVVSRASSYGSQASASGQAPALAITTTGLDGSPRSPDLSTPLTPLTKAATVASYFPPPPTNVTSPDDAFQAYARERSGSIAAVVGGGPLQQQVNVRRSQVGDNNPFRSSMFDATNSHAQ